MRAVRTTPVRLSWRVMGKARTLQVTFLAGLWDVEKAAAGAVDVGLAGVGDGAEDVAPVAHEGWHLVEDVAAGEPVAGLAKIFGGSVVAVQPVAVGVEDLDEDVGADGERDAGVVRSRARRRRQERRGVGPGGSSARRAGRRRSCGP